ncbi:protein transport protein SEC16B homolog isoform X2 [Malania oleifera]|uniref:protein transport protein SEC16B homolog isoform X2 n=1 Tax=Malania oleifera TaxID=397392 RepID=UPI0025ADA3AA|nr:protein transport protein SEC16B homolog isoform X2 [Malania oleifera]
MASASFLSEDQTDEDFFDKLVDDEFDGSGSGPSFVNGDNTGEVVDAFSNLSVSEVGPAVEDSGGSSDTDFEVDGEKSLRDGVVPAHSAAHEDVGVAKENISLMPNSITESSVAAPETQYVLDSASSKNAVSRDASVKEIQWSSFDSESHLHNGFGSCSDFFNELGNSSGEPFAKAAETAAAESSNMAGVLDNSTGHLGSSSSVPAAHESCNMAGALDNSAGDLGSDSSLLHQEGQNSVVGTEHTVDGQDLSSSQYWESLYPGWRFDPNIGEWHQVDGSGTISNVNSNVSYQDNFDANAPSAGDGVDFDQRSDAYHFLQTAQVGVGSVANDCTASNVSNINQVSQGNAEYPAHMVFDPQYPGWYYDTIAQEWRLLESYTSDVNLPANVDQIQQIQIRNDSTGDFSPQNHNSCGNHEQLEDYGSQGLNSKDRVMNGAGSVSNYDQQRMNVWQPESVSKSEGVASTQSCQLGNFYDSTGHVNNSADQLMGFNSSGVSAQEHINQSFSGTNGVSGFPSFIPIENFSQHNNQLKMGLGQQIHSSSTYFDTQNSSNFSQQPLQSGIHFSSAVDVGRSSAGRPPHALVAFGFGGKLIVMKNSSSFQANSAYENQESVVNVLNLMEIAMDKTVASNIGVGACDYLNLLCQQTFPGPLVGGTSGGRELNKWMDDKIANCESSDRLLFCLLKIACQHYGKLRSPFGTDQALKESNCPESALAKLFASAKRNVQLGEYGTITRCLRNLPSEGQIQATALEVQKFLVSGKMVEALHCAQEGQLWGPALVLASRLGDQFYSDTLKQMALHQLVAGSPLRTLCLLIAGQPAQVFSDTTTSYTVPGAANVFQRPIQVGANCMLEEWEENLAVITANRTSDDELVIIHLGDCLWKESGDVSAAHICYLVAEANFESYSDSARLCLIGADHWKCPRTYASPEAIQRTELYEYSKVIGNSQFILLPFQPYKLIYAHMLAEVGKVSDSLKYCQAILKSPKTGRAQEVETWKTLASSLEERIRFHLQGGYSANLAPTKLVGKLLTLFDATAHRVVGGLPPTVPSTSHGNEHIHQPATSHSNMQHNEHIHQIETSHSNIQHIEHMYQPGSTIVYNSHSTMAMSSLIPSVSMEPISEWTGETNQLTVPNRSVSEPDFGKSPAKIDASKEANTPDTRDKGAVSTGLSRFGHFGSQLFQKTVGLVVRSRPDRQAKLGEKNKFYYDEKLKRWVEEGAEPPVEESALAPPPTAAALQNGMPNHYIKDAPENESLQPSGGPQLKSSISSDRISGIPPVAPGSNQFSARGRIGVRSRYVDTFNKGGGTPTTLFPSPSIPAAKSGGGINAKFFIPTPAASGEEAVQATGENTQKAVLTSENSPTSAGFDSLSSTSTFTVSSAATFTPLTMQRFPSMDNIAHKRTGVMGNSSSSHPPNSRRAASWSGGLSNASNPSNMAKIQPLGEPLGVGRLSFVPSDPSTQFPMNSSNFGDELHEVEL